MSALDAARSWDTGQYVPAFMWVLPGGMSSFGAEGLAVDEREKWCQVSLSVPGAADMTVNDAVAILESGSGITTMSVGITNKLQAAVPHVQVVGGMLHPGNLKVADDRVLAVEQNTCPMQIALHASWGLVTLDPVTFAVMPGGDDVVILGNPTVQLLGIDDYDSLGARAREHRGVWPLRVFLEELMAGAKRRTKLVESNWAISAEEWTSELIGAWDTAQILVAHAMALSLPKPGWAVLMFPDATDEH